MNFKAGHWYYFITSLLFFGIAIIFKIRPGSLVSLDPVYREIVFWVLIAWASFRAFNGYMLFKRKKTDESK